MCYMLLLALNDAEKQTSLQCVWQHDDQERNHICQPHAMAMRNLRSLINTTTLRHYQCSSVRQIHRICHHQRDPEITSR